MFFKKTLTPPIATSKPETLIKHRDKRIDEYFWLKEKSNPEVIKYLKAENNYTDFIMKSTSKFQKKLFKEMKSRLVENDSEHPYRIDNYNYFKQFKQGKNYPLFFRQQINSNSKPELILDLNKLAKGKKYFNLGGIAISPDHQQIAYSIDQDGSEKYNIYIKNLKTGKLSPETITEAYGSMVWAEANQYIFYVKLNKIQAPDSVYIHELNTDPSKDKLIYKEKDPRFFVGIQKDLSKQYIYIVSHGNNMSEIYFLDSNKPKSKPQLFIKRKANHEYSIYHHNQDFYILSNLNHIEFELYKTPINKTQPKNWQPLIKGKKEALIQSFLCTEKFVVIKRKNQGVPEIQILNHNFKSQGKIKFPESNYETDLNHNHNYQTNSIRLSYSSLITPDSVMEYDILTKKLITLKTRQIPSGYNQSEYISELVFAQSHDKKKIPITLMYKKSLFKKGKNPLYIYGYGSYGIPTDPYFSTDRLSLIDRGFVFAIAHIRGSEDKGQNWYLDGKLLNKKNTFLDFISATEYLVKNKYCNPKQIVAMGGSAGGLLMGAITNLRPDLYNATIFHVPFVDTLTTTLDTSLPLTALEYNEWGNPNQKKFYDYIKSYSPYDNIEAKSYPNILLTAGLNDPRVTYWEPAKYTAKLRKLKTDNNLLLLKTNMDAGHGGNSGRYKRLEERSFEYAFIFKSLNLNLN